MHTRTHFAWLPETANDYQRDGAVVLRGVLTPAQVERLAEGVEHNLAHPSGLAQVASQPDDPGRFVEDFCTWQDNAAYRDVLFDSALPDVAAQLMRSNLNERGFVFVVLRECVVRLVQILHSLGDHTFHQLVDARYFIVQAGVLKRNSGLHGEGGHKQAVIFTERLFGTSQCEQTDHIVF